MLFYGAVITEGPIAYDLQKGDCVKIEAAAEKSITAIVESMVYESLITYYKVLHCGILSSALQKLLEF